MGVLKTGTVLLGEEYFANYGANAPGYRKADYSKTWQHHTFRLSEILKIHRARFGKPPQTFLDIGAADGRLLKKALRRGLDARGIENSPYILARIRDPEIKARIKNTDAVREIRNLKAGAYDVVVECVAQYLSPRSRDAYLKNVRRICSGVVCLLVDAKNYDGNRSGPHAGVRTFESKTWWRRKMFSLGFKRCEEDFYFFRD